jgi:intraflagellar transport protein 140
MSVFFEYPTDLGAKQKGPILSTAFSNGEQHVMAVSTKNGDITLYLEEGEHMDPEVVLHRSGECNKLHWHPRFQLLAGGWDDGTVTVWGDKERVMREESHTHKAPITLLTFSPDGSRLITGDANGLLVVWAVDHRGRLQVACRYEKKGSITHLVFRAPAQMSMPADGSVLACPSFFFGGSSGIVVFADDLNHSSDVIKAGSPIGSMYYNQAKDYLILVTVDVVLYKYKITAEGKMTQERKVKLSIKGDGSELQTVFAGHGLLAAANGENLVRLWHLEQEDNYTLSLTDPKHMSIPKDIITCLAFSPQKRVLCAGTLAGRVVFWKFIGRGIDSGVDPSPQDWEVLPPVETNYGGSGSGLGVRSITWGAPSAGILSVASKEGISVLNETVLACSYHPKSGASVIQLSSESFCLQIQNGRPLRVQTSIRIKGFSLSEKHVLVWNGKRAEVRELPQSSSNAGTELKLVSSFATKAQVCVISGDSIYACVGSRIEILSLSGVFKNALAFPENDGIPIFLAVNDGYMACCTNNNVLKLWDISRREPKTIVPGRHFTQPPTGSPAAAAQQSSAASGSASTGATADADLRGIQLRHLSINCTGTKIGILADLALEEAGAVRAPDSRMHVYDVELDKIFSYQFGPSYYPIRADWDRNENKLFAVETKKFEVQPKEKKTEKEQKLANAAAAAAKEKENNGKEKRSEEKEDEEEGAGEGNSGEGSPSRVGGQLAGAEVTTLFATSDYGVLMQDSFPIQSSIESLLALDVPHILFMARPTEDDYDEGSNNNGNNGALPHVKTKTMRDFIGLEQINEETKKDLLAFSYFLTVGNMDEAYRAVKKISAPNIWENMAHMSVHQTHTATFQPKHIKFSHDDGF